jgi:hypothetical protein
MTAKAIEQAAMKLPAKARGQLAAALLSTLENDDPAELEQAWIEEADRRYAAYRSGQTTSTPAKRAIASARAALNQ